MPFYSAPKVREKLDERVVAMATPSMAKAIDAEAAANHETRSDVVRRALESYYHPRPVESPPPIEEDSYSLPVFYNVPCGPWTAISEGAERFIINEETALFLEVDDGDALFQTRGESMLEAGIPDGALVAVRPYGRKSPLPRHIVYVQYLTADEEWKGTVKFLDVMDGDRPRLSNAKGEPFPIPDDATQVFVIGRVISQMSRLI